MIEVIAAIVVGAIVIIAVLLYSMDSEDEDELSLLVNPDSIELHAGEAVTLTANAYLDDELLADWDNLSFDWSISNASVGTLNLTGDPNRVLFTAGTEPGEAVVTSNVTYNDEDEELTATIEVPVTVLDAALAEIVVEPDALTIIYDDVIVFNATPVDTLGVNLTDLVINWTVEGIPAENYTLNATTGASVNLTANATGTIWVNATATYDGVTKIGTAVVNVLSEIPVMDITLTTREQKLVVWTCTEPSSELVWGDITIRLTDGTDTVEWSINTTGLDNGTTSIAEYDPILLGTDLIWLNITDDLGNGAANASDVISFTTDGRFNPIKTYVITIVFEPTLDEIVAKTFQGV